MRQCAASARSATPLSRLMDGVLPVLALSLIVCDAVEKMICVAIPSHSPPMAGIVLISV